MSSQDWGMSGLPPEMEAENRRLKARQAMADAMLAASQRPYQQQMAGGYVVPYSPFEGAAKMLSAYGAKRKQAEVDQGYKDIGTRYNEGLARAVQDYTAAKTPVTVQGGGMADDEAAASGAIAEPAPAKAATDPREAITKAMLSQYPQMRTLAQMDLQQLNRTQDREDTQKFRADESRAAREARAQEAQLAREARTADLQARLADQRISAQERMELQRQLAQMRVDAQRDMARLTAGLRTPPAPVAVMGQDGKPVYVNPDQAVGRQPAGKEAAKLPGSALKLQQEEMDAINTSASINADLGAFLKQIQEGKLKLGPIQNLKSKAQNEMGMSDENSRNFQSFQSSLEKLRNDSLRLNKGVQTEGDAQRAWNEMVKSINDPKAVSQRLAEIQKINERAILLRRNNINMIRSNYGVEPLNDMPNPPAAVGGSGSGGGWGIQRVQ